MHVTIEATSRNKVKRMREKSIEAGFRTTTIYDGQVFDVPPNIQRLDARNLRGWQVRYAGTKLFSDGSYGGSAAASLEAALKELGQRMLAESPSIRLRKAPTSGKQSDLPSGISGPIVRVRRGGARDASLMVLLPRFAKPARRCSIYIASESSYTPERYLEALDRAKEMRAASEAIYLEEAKASAHKIGAQLLKSARRLAIPRANGKRPGKGHRSQA